MIINDLSVAPFNIDAVSSISCINVETPRNYKEKDHTCLNFYKEEMPYSLQDKQEIFSTVIEIGPEIV